MKNTALRKIRGKGTLVAAAVLIALLLWICPVTAFAVEDSVQTPAETPAQTQEGSSLPADETTPVSGTPASGTESEGGGIMLLAAAPQAAAAEGEATAAAPVTTPEYEIPAGSAYVAGSEDTVYQNTATSNAIQQAIDAAVAAAQSSVTVVVNNGVYSGGINVIYTPAPAAEGEEAQPTKLALNIIAADAYTKAEDADSLLDANGALTATPNAASAGGVELIGGLSVQDVNVLLAGIYLSLQDEKTSKITVQDADTFTYYGTAEADRAEFELSGVENSIKIDGGAGSDELDVSVTQTPTKSFELGGAGSDLTTAQGDLASGIADEIKTGVEDIYNALTGNGERLDVTVDGGAGDDVITVKLVNSTGITTNSASTETGGTGTEAATKGGTAPTSATITIDLSASTVTVNAGDGADTVTIQGGAKLGLETVAVQPILNGVYKALGEVLTEKTQLNGTEITVNGGAGDDVMNVDTTVSFSSFRGVAVTTNGGTGEEGAEKSSDEFDRTHLTGKLQDLETNESADTHIKYNTSSGTDTVAMDTLAEISILNDSAAISKLKTKLNVSAIDVNAVTDVLANKKTVEETLADMKSETFASFTDYVITDYDGTADFENLTGNGAVLANLVIEGEQVTLGNLKVPNLTLIVSGQDSSENASGSITVAGRVEAKNILASVENTDSHALSVIENDLAADEDENLEIEASLFDIVSDAKLTVAVGGALIAANGAVDLVASSKQTKGLLPTEALDQIAGLITSTETDAGNLNFVAVKVGSAAIELLGAIQAAAVRADASSYVATEATNKNLANFGLPLAVGVVVSSAKVLVDGGSITSTKGGVKLNSDSRVNLETQALSGRLPFTLAVSVVVNDSAVDVKGDSSVDAAGDLHADAYGAVDVTTASSGTNKMPQTSFGSSTNSATNTTPTASTTSSNKLDVGKSGGFFAVSVAIQDVYAAIREQARATAGGNLAVDSSAYEHVTNKATSNPDETGDSMTFDQLLTTIDGLLTKTSQNNKTGTNGKPASTAGKGALGKAVDRMTGKTTSSTGAGSLVNSGTSGATGTSAGTTSSTTTTQLVGALAVTYAGSSNNAYIDTTGVISAGKTLAAHAAGSMACTTLADGSPVKRTSAGATGTASAPVTTPQDTKYPGATQGKIVISETLNGYLTVDKTTAAQQAVLTTVKVTAIARTGYKLAKNATVGADYYDGVTVTADTAVEKLQMHLDTTVGDRADGATWYTGTFAMTAAQQLLNATFVPKDYTLTCTNTNTTAGSFACYSNQNSETAAYYADAEESVYIKVKPNAGYTVESVKVTYTSGTSETATQVELPNTTITAGSVYRFTMPAGNATVTVTFSGETKTLKILDAVTHLTITVSKKDAAGAVTTVIDNDAATTAILATAQTAVGESYTITVTPATGYYLKK